MNGGTFTQESPGRYRVAGELLFSTARDLLKQSASAFASETELSIDLSQVSQSDSAGLALLIEWYRMASRANRSLRFIGAPKQLRALAQISELDGLLPFA